MSLLPSPDALPSLCIFYLPGPIAQLPKDERRVDAVRGRTLTPLCTRPAQALERSNQQAHSCSVGQHRW